MSTNIDLIIIGLGIFIIVTILVLAIINSSKDVRKNNSRDNSNNN